MADRCARTRDSSEERAEEKDATASSLLGSLSSSAEEEDARDAVLPVLFESAMEYANAESSGCDLLRRR